MPFASTNEAIIGRLANVFSRTHVGGQVTYAALSRVLGQDILANRWLIPAALRKANADVGAVFRNVRNTGYERLPNAEAHGKGMSSRKRARRIFRSASKQIENAMRHANDISLDDIRRNWSEITHLGLLVHQTYDRNAPVIPAEPLPPNPAKVAADTLELMRSALGRTKE